MTDYLTFLDRVIDDGIAAVREDYKDREPYWIAAYHSNIARYWRVQAFANEVEWVCNVVSAALWNSNQPTIITPTARGVMKAADILGVRAS